MKLLHIVGRSNFGGAGRIIISLGQMAKAEGWEVDVLTTDPVFQREAARNGLGLLNLDVIRREIRPLWDLRGLIRLRQLLKRDSYRIVHTHTSKGGFVGRIAAALADIPVIVHTLHGFAFHERTSRAVRSFYTALERLAATQCDRITSVSEFHRDWAIELGICKPSRIVAIPNGIPDAAAPPTPPAEVRRSLGIDDRDFMLLTMARLAPDKGLAYLIEAATLLPHASRFRIVIAGDGPERERLEQLVAQHRAADRVQFLGFREDVANLLGASDLIVLPSLREGLSISLLEAMAASKPIVASSIGSHLEVASQSQTAVLVPPGDARALRDAILSLAEDRGRLAALAARARAHYELRYTEDRMLNAYRQLYAELLQEKDAIRVPPAPFAPVASAHRAESRGLASPGRQPKDGPS